MKSILKILVLAVVPILAVLLAAPLTLGAPGSQLLFVADTGTNFRAMDLSAEQMAMSPGELGYMESMYTNFISVTNTHAENAVTVMFQYYNDDMKLVLSYLRVLLAGQTILVDPFNVDLPGTEGMFNASERLFYDDDGNRALAAIGNDKKKGFNSGRFLIAATAVATRDDGVYALANDDADDRAATILFPYEVVKEEELHKKNNIDAVGTGFAQAKDHDFGTTIDANNNVIDETEKKDTTRNTGSKAGVNNDNLHPGNARAIHFNWLIGHQTTAMAGPTGVDSTASWALGALSRPVVVTGAARVAGTNDLNLYECLIDSTGDDVTHLQEFNQGLAGMIPDSDSDDEGVIVKTGQPGGTSAGPWVNRSVTGDMGALKLSALHGFPDLGGQMFNLISIADSYGAGGGAVDDPATADTDETDRKDAAYMVLEAQTGYTVMAWDSDGDALKDSAGTGSNVGGLDASAGADVPATMHIIVSGITTYIGSNDKCAMIDAGRRDGYSLDNLAELYPAVTMGDDDKFDGLIGTTDPDAAMYNASGGWLKFKRRSMTCKKTFNYPDAGTATDTKDTVDIERTFTGSTVRIEKDAAQRRFASGAQFVLQFVTPGASFGAAWWLEATE